jgi:hypothetical protein
MGERWTNMSVLAFADGLDPVQKARDVAAELRALAAEHGLTGPPVDVVRLAELTGIALRPSDTTTDARTIAGDDGTTVVEYNPSRPRGRLRFSIAHELAHTQFPDVADQVRYRTALGAIEHADSDDNWEVELLCNIVAAELLLPEDAVDPLVNVETDIDFIMETRRKWDVSTEALLRRLVEASPRPLALLVTAASPRGSRIDYVMVSPSTPTDADAHSLKHGDVLQLDRPSAVGQTLRSGLTLNGRDYETQTVGTPAYPGATAPRAMTLVELAPPVATDPLLTHVTGDLTDLGQDSKSVIFAHVVSDSARGWSRYNTAAALARTYPDFPGAYRAWTIADPANLTLGNVHFVHRANAGKEVGVASIVAQAGFGSGGPTRLRYDALRDGLLVVAAHAAEHHADVHVPRIGAGQAGGRWDIIEAILRETLTARGVNVTVHTLPAKANPNR